MPANNYKRNRTISFNWYNRKTNCLFDFDISTLLCGRMLTSATFGQLSGVQCLCIRHFDMCVCVSAADCHAGLTNSRKAQCRPFEKCAVRMDMSREIQWNFTRIFGVFINEYILFHLFRYHWKVQKPILKNRNYWRERPFSPIATTQMSWPGDVYAWCVCVCVCVCIHTICVVSKNLSYRIFIIVHQTEHQAIIDYSV